MDWNPLIVSPSPRDIEEVHEALMKCPYDIMYAKYFPLKESMEKLRDFFLKHEDYTHLIYAADDLVIEPEHIEALREDLQEKEWLVLSGVCNVDVDDHKDYLSITRNLPHPTKNLPDQLGWRWYHWYHKDEADQGITRVNHSGNACLIVARKIVEGLPFEDDRKFNPKADPLEHGALDVMWSNNLANHKIPVIVDTRVNMLHLRHYGKTDIKLGNGYMEFQKWNEFANEHRNQNA
jgi:hypothetical protein